MHRFSTLIFLFLLCQPLAAQDFPELIVRVQNAPEQRRQFMVDSFLTVVPAFPLIVNDTTVYRVYLDADAQEVALAGDGNNWNPEASPLTRLSTTSLWYRSDTFEADARLDYSFVINKEVWDTDPLNPYTAPGEIGPISELRMPAYIPPAEIYPQAGVPEGILIRRTFASTLLQNTREGRVYLPAGYDSLGGEYPVILFHDGIHYIDLAHATTVLDNLIYERRIPPCIAVFLPPVNRNAEYAGNQIDDFSRFVIEEVMATVDRDYSTRKDAEARAVVGCSSNGGNVALYIAMKYPDVFGKVAAQSSYVLPEIFTRFSDGPQLALRLYLDLGTYDIPVLRSKVLNFLQVLENGQYEYNFREFHEGHSWGNWRAHIDLALEYLFGDVVDAQSPPATVASTLHIRSVAPHPLHATGSVTLELAEYSHVQLALWDISGKRIQTLWDGELEAGMQSIAVHTAKLPAGAYFLSATSGASTTMQRIIVR
ncbi:hypothetical protein KQI65_05315 [bacterium]|nr:hypothetical protein [bacterium]